MEWVKAVAELRRTRRPGVLVTLASVRGHSPREAGAKMVVGLERVWGTVGGGNLEAVAVDRARELLGTAAGEPEMLTLALSDKAPYQHGVQCCGGEVTMLLEPLPVVPAVAVFGIGHVGLELARILARHDLDLHLVDSRADQLTAERLAPVLADPVARVQVHDVPVLPELVLGELPEGTHVLVMTHDHAEDAALCDAALRTPALGSIGLIGSSAKWARFERKLLDEGHAPEDVARITTPIGLGGPEQLDGKEPAVIAVSVAAALLREVSRSWSATPAPPRSPAPEPRPRRG